MSEYQYPWPVHPAADLFPELGPDELAELAKDINEYGLNEPVWLYEDPERGTVLLDGRNRVRACELADERLRTQTHRGPDPIAFSISQNLKRRHLTPGQKDFLGLEIERLYAAETTRGRPPEEIRADRRELSERERRSDERAAKVVGASGRGITKAKRIAQKAPDLAQKVRLGTLAIDRADRIIRDREAEQRRIDQARRDAEAAAVAGRIDIREGDFREVLADLEGVDAIVTDPPYPSEFLPLLHDLAAWADKALAPDGVLAVLIGQTHLPEVYRLLDGFRPYRWTACVMTPGSGYVSHAAKVQSNWKPLIVYGGGKRFSDVVRSEGTDAGAKYHHRWGQDYAAFHTIVERLTERGQTVADPFMGSGTTLLAAHALGRHAIGSDTDPESVETARRRMS